MFRTILSVLVAVTFWGSLTTSDAAAQAYQGGRNAAFATRNYLYNRSTVSPYVNLATPNYSSGLSNYFTLVRPQVESQQESQMQQRQTAQMQQQLSQVQDQVRQQQQQSANMMITGRIGWSVRGMPRSGTYLSYYPGFQRIPRR